MFKGLWNVILNLLGKKIEYNDKEVDIKNKYAAQYEDIRDINITSIFSNKLANITVSDSTISLEGNDKRSELLNDSLKRLKKKLKKVVARELGTGGVLVVPYVDNNKIYFNVVSQNRLMINKANNEDIIDCTILAEVLFKNNVPFYRFADYVLENGTLLIRYRAMSDNSSIELTAVPEWANMQGEIRISNVDRMPFMYLKSPVDSRLENDRYGVPITFGCDKQVIEIKETLNQIIREYDLKEAFIGADSTMFNGDGALPNNGLYRKINAGDEAFWEVFSPEIRDSSLYNKLMNQCAMLEKQIGTSKGILTERESSNATATEIKSAMKDTFDLVDDIREELEEGLNDFLYACEVLANYYNLAPMGKYELKTSWDYSLIEDSQTTWNQLVQGANQGVIKKAELRQFITDEDLETAQKVIDEIKEEQPTTKDLLGE